MTLKETYELMFRRKIWGSKYVNRFTYFLLLFYSINQVFEGRRGGTG
jgi:hypothetical protein